MLRCTATTLAIFATNCLPNLSPAQVPTTAPPPSQPQAVQTFAPGVPTPLNPATYCFLVGTHRYKGDACNIPIDRQLPGSPLPVIVPKGTTVEIRVRRRSNLETIQFVQTTDAVPKPNFSSALFTAISADLTGITWVANPGDARDPVARNAKGTALTFEQKQQDQMVLGLDDLRRNINDLKPLIAQLQTMESPAVKSKITTAADLRKANDDFDSLKTQILGKSNGIVTANLPLAEMSAVDTEISQRFASCYAIAEAARTDCLTFANSLQNAQEKLRTALTKIQAQQATISAIQDALTSLPPSGDYVDEVPSSPDHKATIVITAKDVTTGTSTTISTVIVTWQGSNFSISSGLLVSTMTGRTYTNSPVIANGVPVTTTTTTTTTTSTGTTTTTTTTPNYQVTEADTVPSWVTPLVFVNYELPWLHGCKGNCGVLVSGGLGANLTTKTADYAFGPSFRYRDAVFTPVCHYGRETFPANGVYVGDPSLASGTTVPTQMEFKPHFGFAITYRIPIP